MVGFCHRHIPTIFITDKFPPWWDFVMVGMCWQVRMMMVMMMIEDDAKNADIPKMSKMPKDAENGQNAKIGRNSQNWT